jgi:predicted N-acyltransferase
VGAARRAGGGGDAALKPREVGGIRDLPAADWDRLFNPDYPFTRHAFLAALEQHGCVGPRTGWEPRHLALERDGRLAAAMPQYRKLHSYGEFVFDFSWANAAGELGLRYYPKLLCSIPFTPVTGPRIGAVDAAARQQLSQHALAQLDQPGASSLHALFLEGDDAGALADAGAVERHDIQFHWRNRGDADFAAFAARLTHDKRKKILRERRRVAEAGITFRFRGGDELSESDWAHVYALYRNTYEERGQPPYLTLDFFLDFGRRAGTPVRLILAMQGDECVACAICLVGGGVLYGRHWGAAEHFHSLHFETCYYQGIELCLREGLSRFDAGAQGGHKLARGFEPVITRSVHRLQDRRLQSAVAAFLVRERAWVARQRDLFAEHSPYRETVEVAAPNG